jgi:predicted permease
MVSYAQVLGAVAPVFTIIGMGFVARRFHVMEEKGDSSIMKLVVWFLYPCLILNYILGNHAVQEGSNLIFAPIIGSLSLLIAFWISHRLAPKMGIHEPKTRRTFVFTVSIYNYGFIPIPLIDSLFHSKEIGGVLLVYNVAVEATLWAVGIVILSGSFQRDSWKKILNPPVFALMIGLGMNFTGLSAFIPDFFMTALAGVSACAVPLGLMLSGATLADQLKDDIRFMGDRIPLSACLLRLGIFPIMMIAVMLIIPCSMELRQVLVVQAAMPAALLPIVLARFYGGNPQTAVQVVLSTTLVSIFTIPFWIAVGLWLMNYFHPIS